MSEHMFGVTKRRLPDAEVERRDRICREQGGTGYVQADIPGQGIMGWFTGPNMGEPFDGDLARRVLAETGDERDGAT